MTVTATAGVCYTRYVTKTTLISVVYRYTLVTQVTHVTQATLISVIVLNQLVGPPLMEHALRGAGEVGRRSTELSETLELRQLELSSELGGAHAEDRGDDDQTDETNSLRRNSL